MNSFQRIRRESRLLGFFGLIVTFLLSLFFMLIGFVDVENEAGADRMRLIFGVCGAGLFLLFMRGGWMITGGARTHVFTVTEDEIEWGFMGDEKRIAIASVREFYWSDDDGFTFSIINQDGKRHYVPYIEHVIAYKKRGRLLAFLRRVHPQIPITGSIDSRTEQTAAEHGYPALP
ncbi:MAG: hypothetical protein AAF596_10085 [Planctomycetota bacterium]